MTLQKTFDLALEHHRGGRLAEADRLYRSILAEEPRHADALHFLGVIARQGGQYDAAVDLIQQAIAIRPQYPEAHGNLGNGLRYQGRLDEAVAAYRRAISLRPNFADAYSNLAGVLTMLGQIDEAIAAARKAVSLTPNHAPAHSNLGNALRENGQLDQAIVALRKAIACNPQYPDAHRNLGMTLLLKGDFARGLTEYEWRWRCEDFPVPPGYFTRPRWDGSPSPGGTILLYAEQGFGDTLQFIRYARLVGQRCAQVLVMCQAELRRLLQNTPGVGGWFSYGEPPPPYDAYCPLLSVPLAVGTTLATIPREVPYLSADPSAAARWRARMAGREGRLKVGLVWAGSPTFKLDRLRSPRDLSLFAALGQVKGVQFFSLQKGPAAAAASTPPAGMELIDWTGELNDFADTAALIANLDLVISSDTSVAHLAGAMGKPVWTLLPFNPDWRWLLDRVDCPWYPTMRLFRQTSIGDWQGAMEQLAAALRERVDRDS